MFSVRTQNVTMNKEVLLAKISENYEIFKEQYKETVEDYEKLVKQFSDNLTLAILSGNFNSKDVYFKVEPPKNYSEKYEIVIEMLSYSVSTEIELDSVLFKAYVKNQWDWTDNFNTYSNSLKTM